MRVAVLSSGGKDSAAAWWWAQCKGWDVEFLVTVRIAGDDSMMFQVPGTEIVQYQAELAGIQWVPVSSSGDENEMNDLARELKKLDVDALVSGALRSDYQKSRIETMCDRLGIISYTPLWHQSPLEHVKGLVDNGFGVMLTSVACEGLNASWIGKILDKESLNDLIQLAKLHRFNVDGEGGEYETLVVFGPHFNGTIDIVGNIQWTGRRGILDIESITTSFDG